MTNFTNVGTVNGGTVRFHGSAPAAIPAMDAAGIASGGAFLVSELEKRDPLMRKPLSSVTYPRDIPVETGGGWVDYVSAMSVAYGLTGGSGSAPVQAGGANGLPVIQANVDKGMYKAHVFAVALRVMFQDLQRANFVGRSLDQLLTDGVRLAYDKHNDQNVYVGLEEYGSTGLVNKPNVTAAAVADGAKGTGNWSDKTPAEILADINAAITATWAQADYDLSALPNHILLPYEEYTHILNTPVTELVGKSIYDYVMENNLSTKNGGSLFIGATHWCKGAGSGGTDRMVVYVNHPRFVKLDELVPMSRMMSAPNVEQVCYDTAYMANVSEAQILYPQTITYWDGIGGDL